MACSLKNLSKRLGCRPESHNCKKKLSALTNKYLILFINAQQQAKADAFQPEALHPECELLPSGRRYKEPVAKENIQGLFYTKCYKHGEQTTVSII